MALAVGGGRAAVTGDGADVVVVEADTGRVVEALRDRRVLTHGLKHPALVPAGDTAIAAYLLDPGRATYEIDDLAEEIGPRAAGRRRRGDLGARARPRRRRGGCTRAPPSAWPSGT